jgi:hypothetical protein
MTDDPENSNGSKLVARTAQRTTEMLSKWAVPSLLVVVMGMGKLGYDGLVNESILARGELKKIRDEQASFSTRIAVQDAAVNRNSAWIDRTDATMQQLRLDMAAIRQALTKERKQPEGGSGPIPMLWHF